MRRSVVRSRAAVAAAAIAVLPLSLVACSKDDTTSTSASTTATTAASSTTTAAGGGNQVNNGAAVSISEFAYDPAEIKVKANQTVTWTNKGSAKHTVTADENQSVNFKSPTMQPNDTFVFTFSQPGTYTYFCSVHGKTKMSGKVVVEP